MSKESKSDHNDDSIQLKKNRKPTILFHHHKSCIHEFPLAAEAHAKAEALSFCCMSFNGLNTKIDIVFMKRGGH